MTQPTRCESSACFTVEQTGTLVAIHGLSHPFIAPGWAVDTVEAFAKFRDDMKAGRYDHIGQEQS